MAEKILNSRIINKHDTEANWLKATGFTPKQGELIIYDVDVNYPYERIKIGDGVQNVNDLSFYAGSWKDLADKPFGIDGLTTVEWDGNTDGLTVSSDGTAYRVSDLKPSASEVIGGRLVFSNGSVVEITPDVIENAGYITSIYYGTVYINNSNGSAYDHSLSVTLPEPGIYLQKNTYNQVVTFSYGDEIVHYLDEKFIPDTIARISDIPKQVIDDVLSNTSTNPVQNKVVNEAIGNLNALVGDTSVSDQISAAIEEIPEQVQVDWNEKDETSLSYVKNKTHGVQNVNVVAIEEQDVAFNLMESLFIATVQGTFLHELEMVSENGFTVIWDGNKYQKSIMIYDEGYFIGNLSIVTNNEDDNTEEPFVFVCYPDGCTVACPQSEGSAHTVGLSYRVESIQKLDLKFLPDDLAFKSEIPTVPTNISAFVNDVEYVTLGKGNEKTFEFVRDDTYSGDHFIYNAFDYYKVSDIAPPYDGVTAVSGTWFANGNISTQTTLIEGTSCYYAGHGIVIVEPGSCTLSNINFNAPSSGVYLKKSSDTYYQTALSITCAYKCLNDSIIPDNIARVSDIPEAITVDGELSETSMNPVQNMVVNAAINNINTLVGDTAVSEQISEATQGFVVDLSTSGKYLTYTFANGGSGSVGMIGKAGSSTDSEIFNDYTNNSAVGKYSHVEGYKNATGNYAAHAEGGETKANGQYSHSEGYGTTADEDCSHAEGSVTVASGNASHAEGQGSVASGQCAHAEGYNATAMGNSSHAEGRGSNDVPTDITISTSNDVIIDAWETTKFNLAKDDQCHTEGNNTLALDSCDHAEGYQTIASGGYSHSEGYQTKALRIATHAEGYNTTANGAYSHVEGVGTLASGTNQHVQGKYNIEDAASDYAHIVGNGTSSARSNAHTLDWDGNAWFAGDIRVGGTSYADAISLLPKRTSVTLPATNWTGSTNPWSQVVTISGITANSKVDLQPTAVQIVEMQNNDIALMTENNNGVITVYAIGSKPTKNYTMQVLITEVIPV